ncbi:MAG TPA: O-antigen ligase family protein [Burkholderiales bacterium]|nr:O-antigen ligase family protein [Burkholderiales bacterium]
MTAVASRTGTRGVPGRVGAGLMWTEYWFLLAVAVAAVVAVDPLELRLAADTIVKHLALAVVLPAIVLTLVGFGLRAAGRNGARLALLGSALWPLLLLAALVLGGSLHARFVQGIQETFLNVGLYMLLTYGAAAVVLRSEAPEALLRAYFRILLAAAAVMGAYLIANYGVRQVYHEQIFLVIPLAVLFYAQRDRGLVRWAGFGFFLAMAWLSHKYTAYLIGALTVAYIALALAVPRMTPRRGAGRTALVYWLFVLGGTAAALFAWYGSRGALDLPTGNVDYRLETYRLAWERFLDSPLWGRLFAAEAVEKFTLYSIRGAGNTLPSHSDVLDLLANGGILGMALWTWALARIARVVYANLLEPQQLDRGWAPCAHALAVMSVAGVVTYTFNPILLQPPMAFLLWTNLGMLVGLALHAADAPDAQHRYYGHAGGARVP